MGYVNWFREKVAQMDDIGEIEEFYERAVRGAARRYAGPRCPAWARVPMREAADARIRQIRAEGGDIPALKAEIAELEERLTALRAKLAQRLEQLGEGA